ncbi:MAG: hypothetical protein A3C06_04330 [Candidatus Taylorbacteria bacterium RIFCSPHIGHO2_02_FULL_46_13]|uniref:Enolase n=1 Tax=Candidatus Taylorbacteria bacterium RIFCSPHIGHO2_02_FULL_46_13 TaxID=1802312 RepID=A0A1G2MUM9_9BACT|nr:MAG: hypothetical protein A3C06_04330 [Candidatus Taylorbacteria bacterium RIFCSPHIGHO2_02_FULL_46_13]
MTKISRVSASEIRDSRGNPTLSVTVACEDGSQGTFDVPSGASTGRYEAFELRDGEGPQSHVLKAIANVKGEINGALLGVAVTEQKKIDDILCALDGTKEKSRLGGNALIGASVAAAKAAATSDKLELFVYLRKLVRIAPSEREFPFLYMNVINGGKHAKTRLMFQEYMIVPQTESPQEAVSIGKDFLAALEKEIVKDYGAQALVIGDEGGIALDVEDPETPLKLLNEVRDSLPNPHSVRFALDVAASSFFQHNHYRIGEKKLSREELLERIASYTTAYNLLSVEDPFEENDFTSFSALTRSVPQTKVVGDDLTTTNEARVREAIDKHCIGAVIIKPNQIGTLSETLATMALARANGIECIISHRSGETLDSFISDLAFAFSVFGIKVGAPRAKERLVKMERLITIESLQNT